MIPYEIQHVEDLPLLFLTEIFLKIVIHNAIAYSISYSCFERAAVLDLFSYLGNEDAVAFECMAFLQNLAIRFVIDVDYFDGKFYIALALIKSIGQT